MAAPPARASRAPCHEYAVSCSFVTEHSASEAAPSRLLRLVEDGTAELVHPLEETAFDIDEPSAQLPVAGGSLPAVATPLRRPGGAARRIAPAWRWSVPRPSPGPAVPRIRAPNSRSVSPPDSSSTMYSAKMRSTSPAASTAVALVSSGRKVVATVVRSWRKYSARSSAGCLMACRPASYGPVPRSHWSVRRPGRRRVGSGRCGR